MMVPVAGDADVLAVWAGFPVATGSRPLVVVEGYVRVGPSGFGSGEAKLAFLDGAIDSAVELPGGVDALFAPAHDPARRTARRLSITAITRIEADFETDRGPQALPAYALDTDGTAEPVIVLDPATPVWWPERPTPEWTAGGTATIDADGLTLHVLARGGALTEFLSCRLTETDSAVLAEPITRERDAGGHAVHAIGVMRQVSGRLASPLGDRVLINAAGQPIVVRDASPEN
jgi:hypothetical protein